MPDAFVKSAIEAGRLVRVLAGAVEEQSRFGIVYRERELMPSAVRAFLDATTAWMQSDATSRERISDDEDMLDATTRATLRNARGSRQAPRGAKQR